MKGGIAGFASSFWKFQSVAVNKIGDFFT